MKIISHFIKKENQTILSVFMLTSLSVLLLILRIKLTDSNYYLFLIWNLFLAGIPYIISSYLTINNKLNPTTIVLFSCIWLLFLPNAPYIITDLFHLKYTSQHLLWLDTLIILLFAIIGLILFFKSVWTMEIIFKTYVEKRMVTFSLPFLFLLVGFGVYLGRFLRFNSWEIINKPWTIIETIAFIILSPSINKNAWLFTIVFGLFLYVCYYAIKTNSLTNKKAS